MFNFTSTRFWTDERDAICKEMWAAGKSYAAIGIVLGTTRNAVCGRIDRQGWRDLAPQKQVWNKAVPQRKPRKFKPPPPPPEAVPVAVRPEDATKSFAPDGPVPLIDLKNNACHFPLGDSPFSYCAAPVQRGWQYCPWHVRVMYRQR